MKKVRYVIQIVVMTLCIVVRMKMSVIVTYHGVNN